MSLLESPDLNEKLDVWSAGAVCFALLTHGQFLIDLAGAETKAEQRRTRFEKLLRLFNAKDKEESFEGRLARLADKQFSREQLALFDPLWRAVFDFDNKSRASAAETARLLRNFILPRIDEPLIFE